MSPGSRVPSGVCPSTGMPPFPILPPSGAEAPFRESTKVLTWVALCVQPGGHRADAAGSARSRPHTCPVQGRRGQGSEIQASHMPSAGQKRLGQRDPGLTDAHCAEDVAGAVQSRPHTCPLQGRRVRVSEIQASHVLSAGQWPGQRDPGLTHALCRAVVNPRRVRTTLTISLSRSLRHRDVHPLAQGHTARRGRAGATTALHDLQGSLHQRPGRKELVGIGLMGSGQHHCHGLWTLK